MELGYYVVQTIDEAEYRRRLEKSQSTALSVYRSPENLIKVNGFKLNGMHLIHRCIITIGNKDYTVNQIQGKYKKGSIGMTLIKKAYPEQEAREKFPEFFL